MNVDRYARQILFTPLGKAGQEKLASSRIAVVGCGALGTNAINLLLRGGVGFLRVIDRDIVEPSNLHRQVLFDERDVREGMPKAQAVARHARDINSEATVEAHVADLTPRNIRPLLEGADLILDGTDNVETRYLVNDFAVKHRVPWIYGGAVGATAVSMAFAPDGPCLRCLWPDAPPPGALPTCDTAGVLPSAPALAAALQAAAAMRLLSGAAPSDRLVQMDVWDNEAALVRVRKNPSCVACGQGKFDYLDARASSYSAVLCGRNAVQVNPPAGTRADLEAIFSRLEKIGEVSRREYYIEARIDGADLLIFPDGRVLVKGTDDPARARSLVSRYVGL